MAAPAVSASYRAAHIAATKELDFTFSGYNEQVGQLQGISAVSIYVLYAFGMEATDKEKEARVLKKLFVASVTSPRYEESSFKICLTYWAICCAGWSRGRCHELVQLILPSFDTETV